MTKKNRRSAMTEAEKLLAEWVEFPPWETYTITIGCKYCTIQIGYSAEPITDPSLHDEECVWRRAKEYLEGTCS